MSTPFPTRSAAILLALVGALLLFRLGVVPLVGPDEPRYTRVAVEMHRAGDWVTPTLQDEPWLEKTPLFYWLAGIGFSLLGETETAARLPAVIATLLLVGMTVLVGTRLQGKAVGLHAGFVAGTSVLMFVYGRAASMDMLLAATVTAAVGLVGLRMLGLAGRWAIPAGAAFAGLATLAKGPLGLLLPVLVLGAYVIWTREWRWLREVFSRWSIAAFVVVAAPWYAAILVDQGRHFVDVFILGHNVQRFTSTVHNHPGPFWYYLPVLLVGLFPWSGLVLPSLFGLHPRSTRADLFVVLWLGLPLVFFSLAGSKLPGYILPCVPPLAILMGRAAERLVSNTAPEKYIAGRVTALVGLILGALVAAAPALLFRLQEPLWRSAIPLGFWALAVMFLFSRRVGPDPAGALRLLRVGSGGLLLLVAFVAPPILARRESGRDLFIPAMRREVLAWGAWRTAWMAGYFYNDGKVREVQDASEILDSVEEGPTLALVGPGERRRLEPMGTVKSTVLAYGPRDNVLMKLEKR